MNFMPIPVGLDAVASVYSPFIRSHFYSRSCIALAMIAIFYSCYLQHAVNCGRFCFWHRQSAVLFVHETPRETAERLCAKFTRRRVWSITQTSLKVKVKGQNHQEQKPAFSALSAACVRFMSGKTSLPLVFFVFFRSDFSTSLTRFSQVCHDAVCSEIN